MAYNGEVLSVIIDPNHERFSETGELEVDFDLLNQSGDVIVKFDDGSQTLANNGDSSGIPQYYIFAKSEEDIAARLSLRLPEIKDLLYVIFSRADKPDGERLSENTQRAQAAACYLINKTLFNDEIFA